MFFISGSIINLREDYYMGGVLYEMLNHNVRNGNGVEHDRTSLISSSHTHTLDPQNIHKPTHLNPRHTRLTISRDR